MITPQAINLYLKANGINVSNNADQYYRLSGDTIKAWTCDVPQPSISDLASYEEQALKDSEPTYREKRAIDYANELGQESGFRNAVGDGIDAIIDHLNGDSTKLNAYTAKRNEIKQRHPK